MLLQPVTSVVAELCLTRLLRFKTFDARLTVYTKQRDSRRPSCYTQYRGTTLVVNQKKAYVYEWKKPKLLRRGRRRLNRSIHASIRSHSPTAWPPQTASTQTKRTNQVRRRALRAETTATLNARTERNNLKLKETCRNKCYFDYYVPSPIYMLYKLCYERWSRKCIKCFDS